MDIFRVSFIGHRVKESNPVLDDMIKSVADKIEGLYSVWFLGELGNNWSDMCAEELRDYGQIQGVMRQEDFYANKISRADSRIER